MFKRILASALVAVTLLFSVAPPANAQNPLDRIGPWYDQGVFQWYTRVYDDASTPVTEIYGERYTAAQVQWVMYSLLFFPLNLFGGRELAVCIMTEDLAQCAGAVTNLFNIIKADLPQEEQKTLFAQVFSSDRPISGISYVRQKAEKLSLVQPVEAQTAGVGYSALSMVQDLWLAMRNIAYGLLIVAAIVMAFMIMFRVKLNPQTVITVQSAIPKLAIALLLITFSYAIAGFIIDLMYVITGFIALGLSSSGLFGARGPAEVFELMVAGPNMGGVHSGLAGFMGRYFLGFIVAVVAVLFSGQSIFVSVGVPVLGLLFSVILILILIWQWIKISFMFFKALAMIMILTIVAPVVILAGTVMQGLGFKTWLKGYLSNVLIFPFASVLLVLASLFLRESIEASWSAFIGSPLDNIFVGNVTTALAPVDDFPPLLNTGDSTAPLIFLGVSYVFLTTVSKAQIIVKSFFDGRPGFITDAAGGPVGFVGHAAAEGVGKAGSGAFQRGAEGAAGGTIQRAKRRFNIRGGDDVPGSRVRSSTLDRARSRARARSGPEDGA